MTTTFSRQALLDAAKTAVANMESELVDYDERVEEYKAKHQEKWLLNERNQLQVARNLLTKALQTGRVIKSDALPDITRLLYREPSSFEIGKGVGYLRNDYKKQFTHRLDAYRGVVRLLEAADGDTLSINQLKTMGLNKLGDLFRVAANTEGGLIESPLV